MTKPKPKSEKRRTTAEIMDANGGIDLFCEQIAEGKSLRGIAEQLGIAPSNIIRWLGQDPEREKLYAKARIEQADTFANEIIAIADEPVPTTDTGSYDSGAVNDKRLRIDARKWIASKLKPGSYGDKLELSGTIKTDMTPEQIDARIQYFLTKRAGAGDGSKPPDA